MGGDKSGKSYVVDQLDSKLSTATAHMTNRIDSIQNLQPHQQQQQLLHQTQQQQSSASMASYQQKHALHRLRRLKKRSPHRDLVISFVPRLRTSIFNRLDFFYRYSKQEQEVLSCFDFLDELSDANASQTNYNNCDQTATMTNSLDSPRCSQKLYESLIHEFL